MNERDSGTSRFEREATSRRLEKILDDIGIKVEQHFATVKRYNASAHLLPGRILTDEELQDSFGNHSTANLPSQIYGEGHYLAIELIATNMYESTYDSNSPYFGRENDLAEVVHRRLPHDENDLTELADVFIIAVDTTGDYRLDKIVRDYSYEHHVAKELDAMEVSNVDNDEINMLFEVRSQEEVARRQSATVMLEELRRLGHVTASETEINELEVLLKSATFF